jgi:hypothetical protein
MKAWRVIFGAGITLALLVPSVNAQEIRMELARKRPEVVQPAPDPQAVVREAERAVQEYEEQVARERILGGLREHDRQRNLDSMITQQKQALAVQRALRALRR